MSQELLYTSAPQGLKPGSRGFCTVISTQGMPSPLASALESISGYRPVYPPGDPNADKNPVVYSHLHMNAAGKRYHVLSRIADYGLDYSQRANKIAHHVVLDPQEQAASGPAVLLEKSGFMETAWDGKPRILAAGRSVPNQDQPPGICHTWQQLTGDAGWAGVLAESLIADPERQAYLIFQPGMDVLALMTEAVALLPRERRWEASFSTYFTSLPPGVNCNWRCVLAGSTEANQSRRFVRALRIDLTQPLGKAEGSDLVELARTGKSPSRPVSSAPLSFAPDIEEPEYIVSSPAPVSRSRTTQEIPDLPPLETGDDFKTLPPEPGRSRKRPPLPPSSKDRGVRPRSGKNWVFWTIGAVLLVCGGGLGTYTVVTAFSRDAPEVAKSSDTVNDETASQSLPPESKNYGIPSDQNPQKKSETINNSKQPDNTEFPPKENSQSSNSVTDKSSDPPPKDEAPLKENPPSSPNMSEHEPKNTEKNVAHNEATPIAPGSRKNDSPASKATPSLNPPEGLREFILPDVDDTEVKSIKTSIVTDSSGNESAFLRLRFGSSDFQKFLQKPREGAQLEVFYLKGSESLGITNSMAQFDLKDGDIKFNWKPKAHRNWEAGPLLRYCILEVVGSDEFVERFLLLKESQSVSPITSGGSRVFKAPIEQFADPDSVRKLLPKLYVSTLDLQIGDKVISCAPFDNAVDPTSIEAQLQFAASGRIIKTSPGPGEVTIQLDRESLESTRKLLEREFEQVFQAQNQSNNSGMNGDKKGQIDQKTFDEFALLTGKLRPMLLGRGSPFWSIDKVLEQSKKYFEQQPKSVLLEKLELLKNIANRAEHWHWLSDAESKGNFRVSSARIHYKVKLEDKDIAITIIEFSQ